jgi:ribonuclease P protein component
MLKKEFRLTTNFEFNVTRKYGQQAKGNYTFIIALKPTNYTGPTKAGIVISNKFHKNATVRNRTKRLYRQAIQSAFDQIKDKGIWLVVQPKFNAIDKTYEEISTDFNQTLQKIHLD